MKRKKKKPCDPRIPDPAKLFIKHMGAGKE
jgi:hypothetical protein